MAARIASTPIHLRSRLVYAVLALALGTFLFFELNRHGVGVGNTYHN